MVHSFRATEVTGDAYATYSGKLDGINANQGTATGKWSVPSPSGLVLWVQPVLEFAEGDPSFEPSAT